MPEHLRGPLLARAQHYYDPTEPVPSGSSNLTPAEEACWRWCRAFRRAQDAQRTWLMGHGYADVQGHVDWHRYRADWPSP